MCTVQSIDKHQNDLHVFLFHDPHTLLRCICLGMYHVHERCASLRVEMTAVAVVVLRVPATMGA